jgi:hypothetical protein
MSEMTLLGTIIIRDIFVCTNVLRIVLAVRDMYLQLYLPVPRFLYP